MVHLGVEEILFLTELESQKQEKSGRGKDKWKGRSKRGSWLWCKIWRHLQEEKHVECFSGLEENVVVSGRYYNLNEIKDEGWLIKSLIINEEWMNLFSIQ